jgi:radical SAM protein with 4Fe4S-binding SPASM domain
MGCTYCFGAEKNRKGKNASVEMLKKAVDFIAEKKQPVWVTFFSAGEQVGNFRAFKETLDYAVKKLKIEKIKMSTNGTGNPQDYLEVVDRIKSFQVSFDGPPEIQDLQRPLKGGQKSSPLLEKTVKSLAENWKDFFVKATVTKAHAGREEKTIKYFNSLGVKNLGFTIVGALGLGAECPEATSLKEQEKLSHSMLKMKELCDISRVNARLALEVYFGSAKTTYCEVGRIFNVGVDGIVTSCSGFSDATDFQIHKGLEGLLIGRFNKKTKTFEIDKAKVAKLRGFHKQAKCGDCDFKLCWGGCPLRNLRDNGSASEPSLDLCRGSKMETVAYMKYLAERDAIKLKPWLEEQNRGLVLSAQFSELPLSEKNAANRGNYFIGFDPANDNLEGLFGEIVSLSEKNTKSIGLFLLSPAATDKLDVNRSILFKDFLYSLEKKHVLFRVTKPVKISDIDSRTEKEFCGHFSIPKNCFECLEMFRVKNSRVEFCDGRKGPKISGILDRGEVYAAFSGGHPVEECPCGKKAEA